MPRPVLKQNIFFLNFSVTVSQAGVSSCNDTLHSSKLNRRLVLLGVHMKLRRLKCLRVKMFWKRNYVCLSMTHNFLIKMKNQAFKVSVKYEKVQGQKLNMKKTKGLFVGRLRGNCSRFKKNCMGHRQNKSHGYNINTDTVWKTIINKMKSCTQIWKT